MKRSIKAYKLMTQRKNGTLGSLFIDRRKIIPVGEWLEAESHPTKGYAYRPGWHCTAQPIAPHLKMMENRVWAEVRIKDYEIHKRPENQGGRWMIANQMKIVRII